MRLKGLWGVLICLIIYINGCAYFNTFYNAKKFFNDAEKMRRNQTDKPTPQQIALYDKCIERCAKIVRDHKKSGHRDDALFLMGKCFLTKGESEKAISTLQQLIQNYPRSEFVDEALLHIGQAYFSQNNQEKALEIFRETVLNYPHRSFSVRAQFLIGDIFFVRKDYEQAIEAYRHVLEMKGKGPLIGEAHKQLGVCYFRLGDFRQAQLSFEKASKLMKEKAQRTEIQANMAECMLELGEYESALRIFETLRKEATVKQDQGRFQVRMARAQMGLGETGVGWTMYEEIVDDYRNTQPAAEANFYMGEHLRQAADYDSASKFYDAAIKVAAAGDVALSATQRKNEVDRLVKLSNPNVSPAERSKNHYQLGELYYFEFNDTDKALLEFKTIIDSLPDTEYACKAMFALAHILETEKGLTDSADVWYGDLLKQYPKSEYATAIRKKFGLPIEEYVLEIPKPEEPATTPEPTPKPGRKPIAETPKEPVTSAEGDPGVIKWPDGTAPPAPDSTNIGLPAIAIPDSIPQTAPSDSTGTQLPAAPSSPDQKPPKIKIEP